jgi:hypothetical protein
MDVADDKSPVTKSFLALRLIQLESRLDRKIEDLRSDVRAGFRDMDGRFDSFLAKLETYARETMTIPKSLDEHGRILTDHERRLRRLEGA